VTRSCAGWVPAPAIRPSRREFSLHSRRRLLLRLRSDQTRDGSRVSDEQRQGMDEGRQSRRNSGLRGELALIFCTRTVLNSAQRIIYPFLPAIAQGLGISLVAATSLVSARMLAGLAAPLFGPLADRLGRRRVMEWGLLLFALAGVSLVSTPFRLAALVAFVLYGLSKALYDPAIHAYIGDAVPYRQRGRAIGVAELSWSGAWLLAVPASGLLIDNVGWRTPWFVLSILGLVGLWFTHARLPSGRPPPTPGRPSPVAGTTVRRWHRVLRRQHVLALLLASLMLTMANEIPFIVYGAWLEESFGLGLSVLGLLSIVVGLSEATAEVGATFLTDSLGKRRSVLLGLLGLAVSLLVLPFTSHLGIAAALAGVVLMMFSFEFAMVSLLSLATEIAPNSRALLLSFNVAAMSLGRLLGGLSGGWLWDVPHAGIWPPAVAGAVCALLAAILLGAGVGEIVGPGDGE
jgi:predicted MFS family arabinose efflux permease